MQSQHVVTRSGSEIRFWNSWFGGAKLCIDGDLKDFSDARLTSPTFPFLSGSFVNERGDREVVEVYVKQNLLSVGFRILSKDEEVLREKF